MMITKRRVLALLLAGALALTACGDAPDEEPADTTDDVEETDDEAEEPEPADDDEADEADEADEEPAEEAEPVDFRGCLVTDQGGVDDRSFNQTAFEGLERAGEELGIETAVLESTSETDFEPNIQSFIDQDCDVIVTVGFLLAEATEAAAQANPDQDFAIVDFTYEDEYDNLRELFFQTDQAAFLAGYVAAGTTETGTVGTYGGINIPTVSIFMDGYLAGVEYHNQENGTEVVVEGWDGSDGLFVGNFESQDDGANVTNSLLQAGADIIMPVAGPVGLGTATAIEDFGSGYMIWVDTDGFISVPQFSGLMLTSVQKEMDVAVFDTIATALDGTFLGGRYEGTLENDGVAIAPFHDLEEVVPQEVKDALDDLRAGVTAGDISVDPADY